MFSDVKHTAKDWEGTDRIINTWLEERQEMLVIFHYLCQLRPFDKVDEVRLELESFCQILVDYVSCGQFEVFEKIADAAERQPQPVALDHKLMVGILKTTMAALDFSDKYSQSSAWQTLAQDLSHLSEQLARRMEWEDKLIDLYAAATQQQPATSNS